MDGNSILYMDFKCLRCVFVIRDSHPRMFVVYGMCILYRESSRYWYLYYSQMLVQFMSGANELLYLFMMKYELQMQENTFAYNNMIQYYLSVRIQRFKDTYHMSDGYSLKQCCHLTGFHLDSSVFRLHLQAKP